MAKRKRDPDGPAPDAFLTLCEAVPGFFGASAVSVAAPDPPPGCTWVGATAASRELRNMTGVYDSTRPDPDKGRCPVADKPLISLDDWNRQRSEHVATTYARSAVPSGVACPRCGSELLQDESNQLASYPPRLKVWCVGHECGFTGTKVV